MASLDTDTVVLAGTSVGGERREVFTVSDRGPADCDGGAYSIDHDRAEAPASTNRDQAVERRSFLRTVVAAPALLGFGRRSRSLLARRGSSGVAQVSTGEEYHTGPTELTPFENTIISKFDSLPRISEYAVYAAAGVWVICDHDQEKDFLIDGAYPEPTERLTGEEYEPADNLSVSTSVAIPGDDPTPEEAHASAHAEISFTYWGANWEFDEPEMDLPPVRTYTDEDEAGSAIAGAVAVFQNYKGHDLRITPPRPGERESDSTGGAGEDSGLQERRGDGSETSGGDGADSPSVAQVGAIEIDPSALKQPETSEKLGEAINTSNDEMSRALNNDRVQSGDDRDVLDPTLNLDVIGPKTGSGEKVLRLNVGGSTDGPTTSIMTEMEPSEPTEELDPAIEEWIDSGDEVGAVEVELPDSAHVEIAPPGEPIPEPPDDLPQSLRDNLEKLRASAADDSLSIHYAIERPFDDIVREYLSTPGTDHYEQYQKLAPGESIEMEMIVPVETRVDQSASVDAAALSRAEIGQGISLVNDNFGSLPFGETTFGRKTIVFTPTPADGPDTPIVVHTGPDGRIVPEETRRGGEEPPIGAVDYYVSMPRSDCHAILRAENPGEVAGQVWDAGRVSVQPHGLMNQLTYWLATAWLAFAKLLGL